MRHFPRGAAALRRPVPAAFAIALLAGSVLAAPRQAVLIAPPGKTLRLPARALAAFLRALVVAEVAAGAENNLPMAPRAVEKTAEVLHRGGR